VWKPINILNLFGSPIEKSIGNPKGVLAFRGFLLWG